MTFSVEKFEFFLMIMIRVTAFMFTAPFFNIKEAPVRVKIGMGAIISYLIFYILPYEQLSYTGTLGFAVSAVKEAAAGLILGFFANICTYILAFSGQLLDMEMGFSMATEFDPQTRLSISVSGNIYSYAVMLILLVTRMHYYILNALVDSFSVIPLGKVNINVSIYTVMVKFIADYFIIGFRIVLPMFAAMLIVNTILAILAKVAPQMNMFVIGMQLKVLIGLLIMIVMVLMLGSVSDFIFKEMMDMMKAAAKYLE